ncbi:6865_t:CDS:2 [Racocetra persica]|uniref:6865_t:CDS:1 n=1 Tax=Racocetra persica TaxID=160502 RepID=A0ACA9L5K7_9GLOM|nr:6865_t:CDS:2 [Racocetra persica]
MLVKSPATGIIPTPENYGKILKQRDINFYIKKYMSGLQTRMNSKNMPHHQRYSMDVASRFKASVPLTSKKSSEVAKAFEKIYDNSNNPLIYPTLLQCDNGKEWAGQTSQLMKEHGVVIRVIGPYSYRGIAIVKRFNKL